jgi:hypothetical protein
VNRPVKVQQIFPETRISQRDGNSTSIGAIAREVQNLCVESHVASVAHSEAPENYQKNDSKKYVQRSNDSRFLLHSPIYRA